MTVLDFCRLCSAVVLCGAFHALNRKSSFTHFMPLRFQNGDIFWVNKPNANFFIMKEATKKRKEKKEEEKTDVSAKC